MVKVPQEIPNEITREIFSYASLPLRVNRAGEFPWYLGHVCPAWRDVFLSMQLHFWSEIQIEWPDLFRHGNLSKYTERIIDILNFFLRCGQQSPFSFRLYNARFHLEEEAPFDQVLSILAQESKRWQRALLRLWPSHVPALYRVKDSLPRLEYLDLVVWNPHSNGNESALLEPYLDLFETAPLLTQVKLEGSVWWEFDWSTLVSLQMTAKDIDVRQIGLIKLPCLKRLSVFSDVLTVLDAPALNRLDITFDGSEAHAALALNTVIAFLCRSSCKLGCLTVKNCTAAGVKEILENAPTIRNLHLLQVRHTMDMIDWLSGERPGGRTAYPPLNRLVRLRIDTFLFSWYEVNEILGMLKYRAKSNVEHLRKLSIQSHMAESSRGLFDTVVEQLRLECRAQGIRTHFRFFELKNL